MTDDLTSATDGAVGFAEAGWSVMVSRGLPVRMPIEGADLMSIDVASRRSTREEAVRRVAAAGAAVAHLPMVVKQFDSTLRGHLAAETLALLRVTGRRRAIVAPAFPAAGRTTIDGHQFVNGIPVHESTYANDPINPVRSSDVRALFAREGVQVSRSSADRATVTVLDGKTESDLDVIAAEYVDHSDLILAGSTGLMRALARHYRRGAYTKQEILAPRCRVLIVVGSVNAQSRDQLEVLRRALIPVVTLSVDDDSSVIANDIALKLQSANAVALTTAATPTDPYKISGCLSHTVARLVERAVIDALVVTGGETMATILDRLGTHCLTVCREIEPGIPLCCLNEPHSLPLIGKAGGFGSPDILLKALYSLLTPDRKITT